MANYSACALDLFGACLRWQPNLVKACATSTVGADLVGASCTDYQTCRSGLCHTGISQCTDTCGTDADWPATHRCKILGYGQLSDSTQIYLNVCMPAAS